MARVNTKKFEIKKNQSLSQMVDEADPDEAVLDRLRNQLELVPLKVETETKGVAHNSSTTRFEDRRAREAEGNPEPFDLDEVFDVAPTSIQLSKRRRANFIRMRVAELYSRGYSMHESRQRINHLLEQEFGDDEKLAAPLTVDQLRPVWQREYAHWRERVDQERLDQVTIQFAKLETAFRMALGHEKPGEMIRATEAQNKMLGIEAPQRKEVKHSLGAQQISDAQRQMHHELLDEISKGR